MSTQEPKFQFFDHTCSGDNPEACDGLPTGIGSVALMEWQWREREGDRCQAAVAGIVYYSRRQQAGQGLCAIRIQPVGKPAGSQAPHG